MFRNINSLGRSTSNLIKQRHSPCLMRQMGGVTQGQMPPGAWEPRPDVTVVRETMSHLDQMPVPQGSWQEYHDQRNKRWNIQLAASIVICALSFYWAIDAGAFDFHAGPRSWNYRKSGEGIPGFDANKPVQREAADEEDEE